MGRIFISAGHFTGDPGAISVFNTTEADEMIQTRDLLVQELELRGLKKDQYFFSVPDNINLKQTIEWIARRALTNDVAIELHGNSATPSARGAEIYYIAGNNARKENALRILDALVFAVPGLQARGAKPDTSTRFGRLGFCRDIAIPSLIIELCFLSNLEDMKLLRDRRNLFAKGLANGLMEWSQVSERILLPEKIMGLGTVSESRLKKFLEAKNPAALNQFSNLPKLYIDESALEGVNHDIAFCQMCLETGFLIFGGDIQPSQNNFCGLGATGGGIRGACFPNIQTGIKAHIQHLKAYASTEPVKHSPIVDPRFHLVKRGVAPLVTNLSGRWATDPKYGNKILALTKQLLEIN